MVKKTLLKLYRATLLLSGALIIIMLLTAAAIQFWLFPNIDSYKEKITSLANKASNQKIAIGNIKADWQGINPHLSLSNIDIFDQENRPALQLKNTDILLSWLSIPMLEPHLAELNIQAPELTIRRISNGEVFVGGISMGGASKPELPNWLLRQTKLNILNAKVVWIDELRGAPQLSLDHLDLEVFSPPWRSLVKNHRITLRATPSVGTIKPINISASVYGGDVTLIKKWHGNVTMQLKNTDLAAFKPWFDYPIDLQSGIGSAETELSFANHSVQSAVSDVVLDNVQMHPKVGLAKVQLNHLAGKLSWKNTGAEQSFNVDHLTLSTNTGLNLQDIEAEYTKSTIGEQSASLNLNQVNLSLIKPYVLQLPLPADILEKLTALSPTGSLKDISLNWQGNQARTKSYRFNAKFSDLGIQAYGKIPGFTKLTGEINANQNKGKLTLVTQNAFLDFKDTLRWPIPADKLEGEVSWKNQGQVTEIQVDQLSISNAHLSGAINASYLMDGNKGGYLDLKGRFNKGDAKFAKFYYPTILGKDTIHWLDTSILAGRAEDINVTVKGRLTDFPFVDTKNNPDAKKGLFKVTAKLSDALLEYGTGWPTIQGLGINLLFEGTRMELNAHTGHLLGNQIIKSKTTIAQLDADYPILNIDSELKGPVDEAINFVNKSPVAEVTQGFTQDLQTSGSGLLNLSLKIPLQNLDAAQYKGLYKVNNGSMASESIPALSQMNGILEFTENSLTAKNIKAYAFGAPAAFNLVTSKDKAIRIAARGKFNDETIKQILGKSTSYIKGSTDWLADILIQKPSVTIAVRADLLGVTSTLPAPLNKAANEHLSLRLTKKQEPNTDTISINIGNKVGAKVVRTINNGKLQLDRAALHLNTEATNLTDLIASSDFGRNKGLQLSGNLDYLDADAWRDVVNGFKTNASDEYPVSINKVDLKINKLDIFDKRINQLKITNGSGKEGLQANVQSREITGNLQWLNQNNGKLIARLSNLTIPDATPNRSKPNAELPYQDFKKISQDYPALDITAEHFEFNKKDYGSLELAAYPKRDDWIIQKLKLSTPDSIISSEGQWNNWIKNPNTYLNVTWEIKDLGQTLNRFGYPETIKAGSGNLSGQLNWPGSPQNFDTARLNGNLQFDVRKGQILKVQPGVGRLLGLLSLQSLPRRLTLDFRDLFSNGFAFDKITANVKIDRGVMRSDNFLMTGPAANVTIKGETNITKETQQLFIKVIPNVSDSLSLAALAGGPLVGAVAFLAQKILKDPLNKIASTEYEIIGTWDNPQEIKAAISNQEESKSSPLN